MKSIILGNNIISEKSVALSTDGKYVIQVHPKVTAPEVKKELEKLFKVKIIKVNVLNYPAKTKRFKQQLGKSKASKRMIITLKKGQKISEFEFDTKEEKADKKSIKKK